MPKGFVSFVKSSISGQPGKGRKLRNAALTAVLGLSLSGCGAPLIGAVTVGEVLTIAGISASFITGRDLTEHALSAATGKDCRMLESVLRSDRGFCEEHGSTATKEDFGGLMALLEPDTAGTATALASAHQPRLAAAEIHGFRPIDRQKLERNFTLDRAAVPAKTKARGERLSFGFLQASYGQTWSYELTAEKKLQVAEAKAAGEAAKRDNTPVKTAAVNTRPEPKPLPAQRSDGKVIFPITR